MSTLREFLQTGSLGAIRLGASPEFVRNVLGNPAQVSVARNPEVWEYGALSLSFLKPQKDAEPKLVFILLGFHDVTKSLPQGLAWSGPLPPAELPFLEFLKLVEGVGLLQGRDFEVRMSGHHQSLQATSGVQVTFADDRLLSMQYAGHSRRQVRQVSMELPNDIYESIRQRAIEEKTSVSALCSRWVSEHVGSEHAVTS
jgi:hypothetical protein